MPGLGQMEWAMSEFDTQGLVFGELIEGCRTETGLVFPNGQ